MNDFASAATELSTYELLRIAQTLQVPALAGVQPDPTATPAQQAQQLAAAEQTLHARNLAKRDEGGQLLIAREVLEMVGTCAYPQASLILYYADTSGATRQSFGHVRENWAVQHTAASRHTLQRLPDVTALVDALLAASGYSADTATPANLLFQISQTALVQARSLAEQRQVAAALATLQQASVPVEAAHELVALLSRPYATAIFVALQYQGAQVLAREYTIVRAGNEALLMVKTDAEGQTYQIQSMQFSEFRTVLLQSMGVA